MSLPRLGHGRRGTFGLQTWGVSARHKKNPGRTSISQEKTTASIYQLPTIGIPIDKLTYNSQAWQGHIQIL
jgi:hypothetical protein